MDDLSGYFKTITRKTISVCADCEVGEGHYHRKVEHPLTNAAYTLAKGGEPGSPRTWVSAIYNPGVNFLAHKEVVVYG